MKSLLLFAVFAIPVAVIVWIYIPQLLWAAEVKEAHRLGLTHDEYVKRKARQ